MRSCPRLQLHLCSWQLVLLASTVALNAQLANAETEDIAAELDQTAPLQFSGAGPAVGSFVIGEWFYSYQLQASARARLSYIGAIAINSGNRRNDSKPRNGTDSHGDGGGGRDGGRDHHDGGGGKDGGRIISAASTPGGSPLPFLTSMMNASAPFDFVVVNDTVPDAIANISSPPYDVFQFPAYAVPYVLAYNLPYGGMMDPTDPTNTLRLVLDRATVSAIFNLRITNWRDPAILALQRPDVAPLLPNATIQLVVRDQSPDTLVFQRAVQSFNASQWRWNVSDRWDNSFTQRGKGQQQSVKTESATMFSQVLSTANSLAYVPLPLISTQSVFKYASMINRRGELLDFPDLTPAMKAVGFDPVTLIPLGPIYDVDAPGAWPIGNVHLVAMRVSNYAATSKSCDDRTTLMKFWRWVLTTPSQAARAFSIGYTPIPPSVVPKVLSVISSELTCPSTGASLLAMTHTDQHSSRGVTVLLVIDLGSMAFTSVMVIIYLLQNFGSSSLNPSVWSYYLALWAGSLLNFASVILFWMVPDTDSVCQGRLWMSCLGMTLMLSALFCRAYQVWAIRNLVESRNMFKTVRHCAIQAGGTLFILGLQVILLGVWTAVDKFSSTLDEVDEVNLTYTVICASQNPRIWWGLEIAFALALLTFGLYVVYQTWDLKHMVKESKWISISIYNCVVTLILAGILLGMTGPSDDGVFWVAGGAVFFLTLAIMLAIFLPRVLAIAALTDLTPNGSKNRRSSATPNGKLDSTISSSDSRLHTRSHFCPCGHDPVMELEPSTQNRPGTAPGPHSAPHSDISSARTSPRASIANSSSRVPMINTDVEFVSLKPAVSHDYSAPPSPSRKGSTTEVHITGLVEPAMPDPPAQPDVVVALQ